MFDYRFLSQEDIVKILLSCDKELKLSYDLYQDFLFLIKERRFNKFKGILKVSLRTFKKHIDYIENSLNFEYSNGRIEGIISTI